MFVEETRAWRGCVRGGDVFVERRACAGDCVRGGDSVRDPRWTISCEDDKLACDLSKTIDAGLNCGPAGSEATVNEWIAGSIGDVGRLCCGSPLKLRCRNKGIASTGDGVKTYHYRDADTFSLRTYGAEHTKDALGLDSVCTPLVTAKVDTDKTQGMPLDVNGTYDFGPRVLDFTSDENATHVLASIVNDPQFDVSNWTLPTFWYGKRHEMLFSQLMDSSADRYRWGNLPVGKFPLADPRERRLDLLEEGVILGGRELQAGDPPGSAPDAML